MLELCKEVLLSEGVFRNAGGPACPRARLGLDGESARGSLAAGRWRGKRVKPQLCNVCFIQSKDLFTEKIPTHPELR